jgi:beta-glucosidase
VLKISSKKTLQLIAAALLLPAAAPLALHAQGPMPDTPAVEKQVDAMVNKLTLQQKLELIGGVDSMYIRAEPSIGLPRLKMSDDSLGVRTWGPDTSFAANIALAATWDPSMARQVGESLGRDARARGVNFLLGPGVNIYRAPVDGRNFEFMGEDPYLAGHMAANFILGLQSQGVIATVKHFTANNAEYNRHNINAIISERALHEIYLPAFKDAIKIGHAGAVMDSYNLVNGEHSTQNKELNINILRKRWGFKGIVMSDWFATYSAVGAANGGLDLEMPFGKYMNPKNLMPAINSGKVSIATINDKVRHILRDAVLFGFLNRPQLDPSIPKDNFENQQVALREALESITLLKNKNHLLPLSPSRVHTIAILGPDAWPMPEAGGSSHVSPYNSTSFLTGLVRYAGTRIKVLYLRGIPSTADFMKNTEFVAPPSTNPYSSKAVKVETFNNPNFEGTPHVSWAASMAGYHPSEWGPTSKHPKSIRYTATFMPKTSGKYIVVAAAGGSDQYKVMVNGKLILSESTHEGQAPHSTEISLTAGQAAHIVADYQPVSNSPRFGMGIEAADQVVDPEVKQIASLADAVIVSVGFNQHSESEGFDRSFELPFGQNELINAAAAANKNTIVTICAGGNVDMQPWIHNVSAIFDTFYPGQEGGPALAQLIFGEHDPQGHLPASYEADWSQNPTYHNYYGPKVPWGTVEPVKYAEGVYVGYRYYTTFHKPVLFPFGFGLSYTTFSFSHLKVTPENADPSGDITVSFDVTNTGQREGADVAQLYVGDPSAKIKRPVEELKGYQKVRLMPGETQHVVLHLDHSDLAYWSDQKHGWEVDPGKFIAYVGDSSEHLPLQQSFNVK